MLAHEFPGHSSILSFLHLPGVHSLPALFGYSNTLLSLLLRPGSGSKVPLLEVRPADLGHDVGVPDRPLKLEAVELLEEREVVVLDVVADHHVSLP